MKNRYRHGKRTCILFMLIAVFYRLWKWEKSFGVNRHGCTPSQKIEETSTAVTETSIQQLTKKRCNYYHCCDCSHLWDNVCVYQPKIYFCVSMFTQILWDNNGYACQTIRKEEYGHFELIELAQLNGIQLADVLARVSSLTIIVSYLTAPAVLPKSYNQHWH